MAQDTLLVTGFQLVSTIQYLLTLTLELASVPLRRAVTACYSSRLFTDTGAGPASLVPEEQQLQVQQHQVEACF